MNSNMFKRQYADNIQIQNTIIAVMGGKVSVIGGHRWGGHIGVGKLHIHTNLYHVGLLQISKNIM